MISKAANSRKFNTKIVLVHLLLACQLFWCPVQSHGHLVSPGSGHQHHFDVSNQHDQSGHQRYQAVHGEKSGEHGFQQNDLDKASLNKVKQGHSSHQHESANNQADHSVNHVDSSSKHGKERVVKHQWDRGGGYVKEWNWDKGVHYEKESNGGEEKKTVHHEHGHEREAREKGKGQSGYLEHHRQDHDRRKGQQGYGAEHHRHHQSAGTGHHQNHHRNEHRNSHHEGHSGGYPIHGDSSEPVAEFSRRKFADLRQLIQTKYLPILHRYGLRSSRYAVNRAGRGTLIRNDHSSEILSPNRWKLVHLFGNGLDAFLPDIHEFRARKAR